MAFFLHAWKKKTPYVFIFPFFATFALFGLFPLLFSVYISFTEYKIGKPTMWIGLDNYIAALGEPLFWKTFLNVFVLLIGTLPLQLIIGFILATMLNLVTPRLKGFMAGVFYLPVITNLVAVALVFQLLFDEKYGIMNYLLSLIGVTGIDWLTSVFWSKVTTVMLIFWKGVGWYIVFILAAIQSVDAVQYEVAKLEGANALQRAFYVTIPAIKPILFFLIVMGTIAGFQIFTEPFLLFHGSGPEDSVLTPSIYIYQQGFEYLKFGYASAAAVLLGLVITTFAALQFKFSGKVE